MGKLTFEETDHLIGQVVINSLNPSPAGQWIGEVRLDPNDMAPATITLVTGASSPNTAPHYQRVASTIGGGAVGLVPFDVHDQDCIPPHNGTAILNAYEVTLRFYGPVTWDQGILPFIVDYWNGSTWVNDNNQWSVLAGKGTRTITLLYSDESDPSVVPSGRDYRITPVTTGTSKLLCDKLLTTSDVLVDYFTYLFSSF